MTFWGISTNCERRLTANAKSGRMYDTRYISDPIAWRSWMLMASGCSSWFTFAELDFSIGVCTDLLLSIPNLSITCCVYWLLFTYGDSIWRSISNYINTQHCFCSIQVLIWNFLLSCSFNALASCFEFPAISKLSTHRAINDIQDEVCFM